MVFPKIALIGRPNVGKSALFNRLLKKRVAIVDEMEGVTRDRIYGDSEFEQKPYMLIDTAGIETQDHSELNLEILQQSKYAIAEADFCILIVDGQVGVTRMDQEIAHLVRKLNKPVCLAVNKIDIEQHDELVYPFHALGFDNMWGISAAHGRNIYELLETVFENLPDSIDPFEKPERQVVSIVGRTNAGKSTLVNYLTHQARCVVSPEAGTTRDAIEIELAHEDQTYLLIDTAGVRRKNKEKHVVEKFAHIRTMKAIEKSDVCLFILDVQEGLTSQEKKVLSEIYKMGKSCIIVANKWDLVSDFRMEHVRQALIKDCPFLVIYPIVFISAKTGRNVENLFPTLKTVFENRNRRVDTAELNRFILEAVLKSPPPMVLGKRLRVYYMTQIKTNPPTFLFFVNKSGLLNATYKRYLTNQMRDSFDFFGSPLQFFLRSKKSDYKKSPVAKELANSR